MIGFNEYRQFCDSASHPDNGGEPGFPICHWRSVHGSERIFRLTFLTRLPPIPGSLADSLSLTRFHLCLWCFIGLIMP
jgi:hypothetical protein